MTKTETLLLKVAYAALLMLRPTSMARLRMQSVLVNLRNELVEATGRDPQELQEGFEASAFDICRQRLWGWG